jgi:hypothetical protein
MFSWRYIKKTNKTYSNKNFPIRREDECRKSAVTRQQESLAYPKLEE